VSQDEYSGIGVGDILHGVFNGSTWDVMASPEFYADGTGLADESSSGGLALLPSLDVVASSALAPDEAVVAGVLWFDVTTGRNVRYEEVCPPGMTGTQPFRDSIALGGQRPGDEEPRLPWCIKPPCPPAASALGPPSGGDLELLCADAMEPSPTPTPSVTPTTARPSPSPTALPPPTDTPESPPVLRPIYLPVLVKDPECDPDFQHADVVLVVDASTSMRDRTSAGRSKLAAAQEAATLFVERLRFPGDQAALVAFNEDAFLLQRLTDDRTALIQAIAGIQVQQYTRIDLGIWAAHQELVSERHKAGNSRAMVVLTDGKNNPEPVETAVLRAAEAKAAGITVFTIGLGDEVEVEALRRMASRPQDYYHAPDGEDLARIYQQIAHEVPCPPSTFWPRRRAMTKSHATITHQGDP
jgi:hypothetical protein